MNKQYECGCEFPIKDGKLVLEADYENINFKCDATWGLICAGNNKGLFQLESFLGEHYSKLVAPDNISELSDLIALIRPSCLQGKMEDGKSITDHYILRKNEEEPVTYIYDDLEPILKDTYGLLIYQEQAIRIGMDLAKMTPQESDTYIRYAIGKKKVDLIAEGKKLFIKGCIKNKIKRDIAEQIFGWIEAAQRYSFNKSHSVSFAYHCYWSAYLKTHFPKVFFLKYLKHAKHRLKKDYEIQALIQNAKDMDIEVYSNDIRDVNKEFAIIDGQIKYGLIDIKGIGSADFEKIKLLSRDGFSNNWAQFLYETGLKIKKTSVGAMINAGSLDYLNVPRRQMIYEFETIKTLGLTTIERQYLDDKDFNTIPEMIQCLLDGGVGRGKAVSNKRRLAKIQDALPTIENPPYKLEYTSEQMEKLEKNLMCSAITVSRLDDNRKALRANISCSLFKKGEGSKNLVIAAVIKEAKFVKTKKGQDMAILSLEDQSGSIDSVLCFQNILDKHRNAISEDAAILVYGSRSEKMNKDGFIVNRIEEI